MAALITIRTGSGPTTGAISPAASSADVLAAISRGDDILIDGQAAVLSNSGGVWFLNGHTVDSWFSGTAATSPGVTTALAPTLAQVCSGLPLAPPLPTPSAAALRNLPARITLQVAPTLPPQPASSALPPAGCVTLSIGGKQRASSSAMDMQAALDGGASVLRGDGSFALIQSLTAPGWPPNNYLIDGNPITATLGQGFLPGQLDLIHQLAASGLTISATLESVSAVTYPPPVPVGVRVSPGGPTIQPFDPNPAYVPPIHWDTLFPYIAGAAVLYFLVRKK